MDIDDRSSDLGMFTEQPDASLAIVRLDPSKPGSASSAARSRRMMLLAVGRLGPWPPGAASLGIAAIIGRGFLGGCGRLLATQLCLGLDP